MVLIIPYFDNKNNFKRQTIKICYNPEYDTRCTTKEQNALGRGTAVLNRRQFNVICS